MAIKDRITKKTTKTLVQTTKRKPKIRSGIDVLDFFEMNKSISGLFIYDNNNIFVEKDGLTQRSDEAFDISFSDLIRVIVSKYENNFVSVGDSYVVLTENGTQINIVSKPYLKSGSFISFKKQRNYEYSIDYFLKHQVLNYDISDYLWNKIKNGENIFVVGASYTDKLPILSYLSGLSNENTAIIQGLDDILTEAQNHLVFSKYTLSFKEVAKKAFELNHNLVVTECSDINELMSVFEFINSGFKHFIASFNVNSKEDFLDNLKNNIMLNYPQMSEDKISGLIASTIKNIVFLDKMADGQTRVSHVCELKSEDGKIKIEDLFTFDFADFKFSEGKIEKTEEKAKKPKAKSEKLRKVVLKRNKPSKKAEEVQEKIEEKPENKEETVKQEEIINKEEVKPAETEVVQPIVQKVVVERQQNFPIEPQLGIEPEIIPAKEIKPEIMQPEEIQPEIIQPVIIQPAEIKTEEIKTEEVEVKTEKINKYKLLKEKIKHKREQI